jgi:putative N6-adenine-specific DNA methylase
MIDTSGIPLHKRGYRKESNAAPIRETLAAAIAATSRPRENVLFWDPMCGSGTIAIEAAMLMKNIAPGLKRDFAAKSFPQLEERLWRQAREEAQSLIRTDTSFETFASDLDPECVELTRQNALRAGVADRVRCFRQDALTITTQGRRGTVVTNPPYGQRLGDLAGVEKLYQDMGRHFATLDAWQIYVITSHEGFQRLYGRRADKVRRLYNGMIRCQYYQFFKKK